ncbi:hypothetical protein [Phyllobacterium leguminum]|uniref:Uncharacterized protein n=1 Tax=Phyllobacterium leguminum TaxID=314237 RepID=A0A318T690_9HYPH|nr:hypothetical protein [Phyllobacterium leguminum]PYE90538.1 hypothetical protein C7477_101212 [Phyllobacterium leguminum]
MQDFETRIRPAIVGTDGRVGAYTVEFRRRGKTFVAVTLYEGFGMGEPAEPDMRDAFVAKAKALMREVLTAGGAPNPQEPPQPEGPPFSSSQTEPQLDDAPTIRVRGEGMIRPEE